MDDLGRGQAGQAWGQVSLGISYPWGHLRGDSTGRPAWGVLGCLAAYGLTLSFAPCPSEGHEQIPVPSRLSVPTFAQSQECVLVEGLLRLTLRTGKGPLATGMRSGFQGKHT